MKIQSTNNKQHLKKAQKKQTPSTSFGAMLNAAQTDVEQTNNQNMGNQSQTSSNPDEPLETHIQALEEALNTMTDKQQSPEHIQQTIVDLRQALQQSKLTPRALEDADTLLAVEAKRLKKLSNQTP